MKQLAARLLTVLFLFHFAFSVLGPDTISGEEISQAEMNSSFDPAADGTHLPPDFWADNSEPDPDSLTEGTSLSSDSFTDDSCPDSDSFADDSGSISGSFTDDSGSFSDSFTDGSDPDSGSPEDDASPPPDSMTDESVHSSDFAADESSDSSAEETTVSEIGSGETADIGSAAIRMAVYAFYTGNPVCPKPVISHRNALLSENTDYHLEYTDNLNPGTAAIRIQGINRYFGTVIMNFTIVNVTLSTKYKSYDYTGYARKPGAVISGSPYALQNEVDYTLSYRNNKKCGTGTIQMPGRRTERMWQLRTLRRRRRRGGI